MKATIVAAVVQLNSTLDKPANLERAEKLVRQAQQAGAELIVLPELFNAYGPLPAAVEQAEPIPGPTSTALANWASELGIYLCGGSLAEVAAAGQAFNTSLLFDPAGEVVGKYRKIHRFDVELNEGCASNESAVMQAGEGLTVQATPWGVFGQAICYDLRFPELFRQLAAGGMEVCLFPAAFTAFTGAAHWDVLIRARAIENQAFFLAANQVGSHGGGMESWGHSAIVDPWGNKLAEVAEGEGIALGVLEAERMLDLRRRLPVLGHRRL